MYKCFELNTVCLRCDIVNLELLTISRLGKAHASGRNPYHFLLYGDWPSLFGLLLLPVNLFFELILFTIETTFSPNCSSLDSGDNFFELLSLLLLILFLLWS